MYSRLILLTVLVVLSVLTGKSQMPGDLDISYGDHGLKVLQLGTANALAVSMVMQEDDKAVVAGIAGNGSNTDFVIVRLTPQGQPDDTFGEEGIVFTDFDSTSDIAQSVAMDQSNRIVAGGYYDNGNGFDFGVARYLQDGTLDPDFGEDGRVTTAVGTTAFCRSVAVQDDNKIVAAGYFLNTITNEFIVIRYTEDGQLDSTFHHDGIVTTNFGIGASAAFAMAVQPDGKLVVAGQVFNEAEFRWEIGIVRYLPDGSLDATWDGDGLLTTGTPLVNHTIHAIVIDNQKRILVGGYQGTAPSNNLFTLARYLSDGKLDPSFDEDGILSNSFGAEDNQIKTIRVQPDGKILAGGSTLTGNSNLFAIARFNDNGSFDDSFGEKGIVLTPIGQNDGIEAMSLQEDGKLVVAGESFNVNRFSLVIARYETGLSTSIQHPDDFLNVTAYPNPASGSFQISVDQNEAVSTPVHIYTSSGQLQFSGNLDGNKLTVTTDGWTSGIYYVQVDGMGKAAIAIQ